MQDTSPGADARYRELLARLSPAQRLQICSQLTTTARAMAIAGIRSEVPDASPLEVRARLAERLYGREVRLRLFPQVG